MNIFHVLSQGNARLNETSMSAMLGYLLNPGEDHGLGKSFLLKFISLMGDALDPKIQSQLLHENDWNAYVTLEDRVEHKGRSYSLDIVVHFYKKAIGVKAMDATRFYAFVIENKVKASSANPNQLAAYYDALMDDRDEADRLAMVFLTPQSTRAGLTAEFDNLTVKEEDSKVWLFWNDAEKGVLAILRTLLAEESLGEIPPLNEYLKHTIKGFMVHIRDSMALSAQRPNGAMGDVVRQRDVMLDGKVITIEQRTSQQVRAYQDGELVSALSLLKRINEDRGLGVPLASPNGTPFNTRILGRLILNALEEVEGSPSSPFST